MVEMREPEDLLREATLRVTRPRIAVLEAVRNHPHADADTITGVVRDELGGVSKQAVYDVLAALTDRAEAGDGGEDGATLGDFLEDDSAVGPDELAVEAVGREALEQVLNALPERERQVLILRFGLDSGTPRTLEEVGAVMGFSRERARQVERDALAALRSPEIRARLEDLVAA